MNTLITTVLLALHTLISIPNVVEAEGYNVGDQATDFSLMNVDGNMVSLADYPDAKGYIVIFTCNSCPWAVLYEDRIIDLHNKWADKGYPVIAINPNDPSMKPEDSYAAMKVRAAEKNFPFPYVFDKGQKVFPVYGATKTPHVYFLDETKKVRYIGAIDDNPRDASGVSINYVENAINAVKTGTDPDPNFTKAIGCSIKTQS
jgi:peroxiredoxin